MEFAEVVAVAPEVSDGTFSHCFRSFQPFHNGHASMIEAALGGSGIGICIGSSEAEQSLDNLGARLNASK